MHPAIMSLSASEWAYHIVMASYALTVLSVILVVISENRNPVRSLAWITAVLLLPVAGIVLYAFFGRSLKNRHLLTRRMRDNLQSYAPPTHVDENSLPLSDESKQQIRLAKSLVGAFYFACDDIEIFTAGKEKFDALERDLEAARHSICLQYYIFEDDSTGQRFKDILIRKASQGVRVRVIYDHVGSFPVRGSFYREMRQNGVQVAPFMRITFPQFANRVNWRNHRKVAVIDGHTGYIGGMNIADRYIDGVDYGVWRDTHLRLTGDAARGLQLIFALDWNAASGEVIDLPPAPAFHPSETNTGVQYLISGPTSRWSNIELMFQKAISNARRRVFIQTPYFLPTDNLLRSMQTAALAGVDVKVMFPRRCDSVMLNLASRSYVKECLEAGIKVYLYHKGMLHAKTVLVDDEFCSTGSANFDFRSFEHNFECNAMIYGKEFNSRMAAIFEDDLLACDPVDPVQWLSRPRATQLKESLVRLMSPIL